MCFVRQWGPYGLVLAGAVTCYAAIGAVLRIVPSYVSSDLHADSIWAGLAVGAPALTGAVLRPFGGRLADRLGPRVVLVTGAGLMAVGAVPSFVPSLPLLVGSRLLVGGGEAVMMGAAVLWLLRLAGPSRHALALGHVGLANYAGLAIGALLVAPLGGTQHPAGVWLASVVLPLIAAVVVLRVREPVSPSAAHSGQPSDVWRRTWRPGIGLALVNVGYVAILAFGATVAAHHHVGIGSCVLPIFAGGVICSRTVLGHVPDRVGPARTLAIAAGVECVGLFIFGGATTTVSAVAALVALSVGQGLAVPSLGSLALRDVPAARRGAAAGMFFAYFDAGVGLGGPLMGTVTHVLSAAAAIISSGVAVALAIPVASLRTHNERPLPDAAGAPVE